MVQQLLPYFPKYSSIAHLRKSYWVENKSLLGLKTITRQLRDNYETLDYS